MMKKILKNLFYRKKIPTFVRTEVYISREVDYGEEGVEVERVEDIYAPTLSEFKEIWVPTYVNTRKIVAVTDTSEFPDCSIVWSGVGNIVIGTKFGETLRWLRGRKEKGSIMLDTRVQIESKVSGTEWAPTSIDLSKSVMISESDNDGNSVVWFDEGKVVVDERLRSLIKKIK